MEKTPCSVSSIIVSSGDIIFYFLCTEPKFDIILILTTSMYLWNYGKYLGSKMSMELIGNIYGRSEMGQTRKWT